MAEHRLSSTVLLRSKQESSAQHPAKSDAPLSTETKPSHILCGKMAMREQHLLLSGVPLPRPATIVSAFTAAHATALDGDSPGSPHEPLSVAIFAQSISVLHAYSACSVAASLAALPPQPV
tara:strand:+ start:731 stop:1093 length:363 start_codon:yes stop_codon:yes gene_type:complete